MANSSSINVAVGRVMVQFQKNRPLTLTDFGASLSSTGGPDGEHSLIEVDSSGLAWDAGFRNNDVIEAINAAELEVKGVSHHSVLEYLRETGRTCNMLIRRRVENAASTYLWIAFKDKKDGGVPEVAKRTERSVGSDITQAAAVHQELPSWALRTTSSTRKFQYNSTEQVRLVRKKDNRDRYLGFFVSRSSQPEPKFTENTFVLNMHTYQCVNASISATVVAFSAIPQRNGAESTACIDDGMESIFGNTNGPLKLINFPSWMTNSEEKIIANPRMFRWTFNNDQTGNLSSACNDTANGTDELYISASGGQACLGTNRGHLEIRTVGPSESATIYPSLDELHI